MNIKGLWLRPIPGNFFLIPRELSVVSRASYQSRCKSILSNGTKSCCGARQRGMKTSFTELYRRHQAALYRFALRMTGNAWAAEEIVQDVFMTLVRDPKKYDVGTRFAGRFPLWNHPQPGA